MTDAEYSHEKPGALECQGKPPQEIAEAVQIYNELLEDELLDVKRIPAKAKRKIFNLLQVEGLQAAILTSHTLNRRIWLVKEGNQWKEYTLHTEFSEMFRSLISNSFLPEGQNGTMPVSEIWQRPVSLSMSYLFGFRGLAICNKETLLAELKKISFQYPHLRLNQAKA
jgi:hypothetical protein